MQASLARLRRRGTSWGAATGSRIGGRASWTGRPGTGRARSTREGALDAFISKPDERDAAQHLQCLDLGLKQWRRREQGRWMSRKKLSGSLWKQA